MTSPESPSDLLRRAADLIENSAAHTIRGPWWNAYHRVLSGSDGEDDVAHATTARTASWIAMMSPSVATPLVAMLRYHAYVIGWAKSLDEVSRNSGAIDLALQILGET